MKSKKAKILSFLSEICMVMIGVFLGMLVTDWNTQRKLRADRRDVLNSVKSELLANKEQIVDLSAGRKEFMAVYDSLLNKLPETVLDEDFYERPFKERLPKWQGIGSYSPNRSMFEAAKYSNVLIGMDISVLENLSRVYNKQEDLYSLHNTFIQKFFEINANTKYREVNRMVWQIRQELWGNQYLLAKEYESAIYAIDDFLKK